MFSKTRSKKNISLVRVFSAVLVLGVLVLIVAESAKYLYVAEVPASVSSKIDPSVEKLASVLGTAKASLGSFYNIGNIFTQDVEEGTTERANTTKSELAKEAVLSIAVLSDSHGDLETLKKALEKAKSMEVSKIVFLGDYTDWGEEINLSKSKAVMDQIGIEYVSLPGDHDLGETRDESNFVKVFGSTHGLWEQDGVNFMYFDNSKNFTALNSTDIGWFKKSLSDVDFLFLSQPLVTSDLLRVMGIIDGVKDEVVYAQNSELLDTVRNSKVRVIISGDLHSSSHTVDPVKPGLQHYSVGAVLKSQSLEKLNLQSPRFSTLTIFNDDSYEIDDVTID